MHEMLKLLSADIDLITYALRRLKDGSEFTTLREAAGDLITRIENRNAGDSLTQYIEKQGHVMSVVANHEVNFGFTVSPTGSGEKVRKAFVKFVIELKRKYGESVDVLYEGNFKVRVWTKVHPDKLFLN
jgi:hypothetical protein